MAMPGYCSPYSGPVAVAEPVGRWALDLRFLASGAFIPSQLYLTDVAPCTEIPGDGLGKGPLVFQHVFGPLCGHVGPAGLG